MQDINERIARRLRALRSERGMTLEALAERSAVSRSMLSVIERGESSPTAVVLEKIATALGVTLATLFDDAAATPSPLSRGKDRLAWTDPDTGYVRRNLSPPNHPTPLQLVEVVLPAGARVAYETGAREPNLHQQVWLLDGALTLSYGDTEYELGKDDCLAMRLDRPIAYRNRGRVRARYVVAIARVG